MGNKVSGKSPVWKREGEMEPGCRANQLLVLSMAAFTVQGQRPCDLQTLKSFLSAPMAEFPMGFSSQCLLQDTRTAESVFCSDTYHSKEYS